MHLVTLCHGIGGFPVHSRIPISDERFLDEPAGPYAHLIKTDATLLSRPDGVLAVVIFGESGVGGSTLLRAEAERRRMRGDNAALIDLAGLDQHRVSEEIADVC
jgi:hypothetical protein